MRGRANGERYRIYLWQPPDEVPLEGLPVIYVLDALAQFATFADTLQRVSRRPEGTGIRPAVLVGIDFAETPATSHAARQRDYTPGPCRLEPEAGPSHGGAPAFLEFLEHELMAKIERELPVDTTRRGLFGHSLAGYFCLWSLVTRPGLFAYHFAISPSLWWDTEAIEAGLTRLTGTPHEPRAYLAVGGWEGPFAPWQRASSTLPAQIERRARRAMAENARAFCNGLRDRLPPDHVRFDLIDGEDHASIVAPAIHRALRFMGGF